ncbi:MAG TPA: GNAT family N-acetyltransferase [Candidatus Binataceae bacterium]|nr:GNAT family N-acetyltransferase [Candidatus Binataceae bacterium]
MKASLTNESSGTFFGASPVVPVAPERSGVARDALTITPWPDALALWRTALSRFSGATLYHCEPWIDSLRAAYSMQLEVAALHRDGDLRAAAVLARMRGMRSTRLVALPFSDCAQPLAIDEESCADFMRTLVASNPAASIEIRGVAGPAPWQNVDCFGHWTLDLKRPYSDIAAGFSRTVKGGIKRGLKDNLQIDRGSSMDYIARFFELQLETRRRLGVPPQPFKFFATVHEKFSRGSDCEVWFARFDGRDHAGLVLLRSGDQLCYKWGARVENGHPGANHLLVARMLEAYAGEAHSIDFGRCDMRNQGLVRSKSEIGCVSRPLPYAFFPKVPRNISSEVLSGPARLVSVIWKRLPLQVTRVLGEAFYRYMA